MNEQETIVDIIAEKRREADYIEETARGSLKAGENYDGIAYTESDLESALDLADTKRKEADRLDAAHKRERVLAVSIMRSKLYDIAEDLRAITARSDARQRGIHYIEVQNIAAKIENIADNGGEA